MRSDCVKNIVVSHIEQLSSLFRASLFVASRAGHDPCCNRVNLYTVADQPAALNPDPVHISITDQEPFVITKGYSLIMR